MRNEQEIARCVLCVAVEKEKPSSRLMRMGIITDTPMIMEEARHMLMRRVSAKRAWCR